MSHFYGKPLEYWMELDQRVEALNVADLILEIAELRKKVNFYESRLDQINVFRDKNGS